MNKISNDVGVVALRAARSAMIHQPQSPHRLDASRHPDKQTYEILVKRESVVKEGTKELQKRGIYLRNGSLEGLFAKRTQHPLHSVDFLCVFSYASLADTKLINRFINFLTKKGKKATAESLFLKTLYLLCQKIPLMDAGVGAHEVSRAKRDEPLASQIQGAKTPYNTGKVVHKVNTHPTDQLRISYFPPITLEGDLGASRGLSGMAPEYPQSSQKLGSLFYIIQQAIENVKPFLEVKKVRVAGTTYQVPCLVQSNRQENLAINWLIQSAFERKKRNPSQAFEICLASEIFEAFQKQGQARNKRNELHKLAEANRAFSHYRWW